MTTLSIQVDEKVEKEAEKLFSDFGLDISTAVNIFLRQSIRENCIPFNIQKEVPNADTLAAMKESEDMIAHPEKYKGCLLYTSPSPRDRSLSRMPSSA